MSKAELHGDADAGGGTAGGETGKTASGDTVTAGGGSPPDDRPFQEAARRAQLTGAAEPNGWFTGPPSDPDRFELLGPGLAGGEGNIWQARYRGELTAPLTVAVKELRRPSHAPPQWPAPADLRRWEDQRALLQYMRIDHLVTVIDLFVGPPPHPASEPGGIPLRPQPDTPYLVMEWVPGPTLADELGGTAVTAGTLQDRLTHVQHLAQALHSLHSRTVSAGNPTLHRDVKPTNCILDPRRGVVLVDVGTMRRMDDGYDHDGLHTPAYTAPEVLSNPQAARTPASDLYSLGALAYFCVLGEDPPTADRPGALARIEERLLTAATSARIADVPGFVRHLTRMLAAEPEQRPADAMSWSRQLRALAAVRRHPLRFSGGPPGRLRERTGLVLTSAAVVVLVAVGAVVAALNLLHHDDGSPAASAGSTAGARAALPGPAPSGPRPSGPPPGAGPPPSGAPPPAGFAPGGGIADGPASAVRSKLAAITEPGNGGSIPACTLIEGTSQLAAGQTLVLSVENLSAGDRVKHLLPVPGWEQPDGLVRWRLQQFVGRPEDPPSTRYRIEAFVVPLAAIRGQADRLSTLPAASTLASSVYVFRAQDSDQASCG
jgi:serine/threonine-protein kinase